MSDNTNLMRDFKMETSFGLSPDSPYPYFSSDHIGPKIITIYDDSGSEGMSETSLEG